MITFEYCIELREGWGYRPTMQDKEETEIVLQISAKNRATADRMIDALVDQDVISDISGVAIS